MIVKKKATERGQQGISRPEGRRFGAFNLVRRTQGFLAVGGLPRIILIFLLSLKIIKFYGSANVLRTTTSYALPQVKQDQNPIFILRHTTTAPTESSFLSVGSDFYIILSFMLFFSRE